MSDSKLTCKIIKQQDAFLLVKACKDIKLSIEGSHERGKMRVSEEALDDMLTALETIEPSKSYKQIQDELNEAADACIREFSGGTCIVSNSANAMLKRYADAKKALENAK